MDTRSVATTKRRWRLGHAARMPAVLLLLVWVGPVTFDQTDTWRLLQWAGAPGSASAESQVIPAGMAMILDPGTRLALRLRDDRVARGRFAGRVLLDSDVYASRFESRSESSGFAPFELGEMLEVSLADGREWTGPFAGYAERSLLLENPDGEGYRRVPFESATEIRVADGVSVEPGALAHAFRAGLLPSAEALALDGAKTDKRDYPGSGRLGHAKHRTHGV